MSTRRDTRTGAASPSSAAMDSPSAAAEERFAADALATLHANGAESDRTHDRAQQIAAAITQPIDLDLGWNTTTVTVGDAGTSSGTISHRTPSALGMNRVLGVDEAIDSFTSGRSTLQAAHQAVLNASARSAANIALFAAACIIGACGLSIIFGISRWEPLLVIAISAGVGAVLRRGLDKLGASNFWQVGVAALLAGLLGSVAVNTGFSSDLRLAVVCPCMILVPGPHLLNGSFDLAALRLPLGISRLTFAVLTLLSIGAGLVAGLSIGGAGLIADPAGRDIPLWLDGITAGVVAVCYGIFYSAPLRILIWPFLAGGLVHAFHWVTVTVWHWESYLAAGAACFIIGVALIPAALRLRVPFAAIGFASVVALMPGVIIFRSLDGLAQLQTATGAAAQQLLVETVNNATAAWLTVFAMAIGILIPASVYRGLATRRRAHA